MWSIPSFSRFVKRRTSILTWECGVAAASFLNSKEADPPKKEGFQCFSSMCLYSNIVVRFLSIYANFVCFQTQSQQLCLCDKPGMFSIPSLSVCMCVITVCKNTRANIHLGGCVHTLFLIHVFSEVSWHRWRVRSWGTVAWPQIENVQLDVSDEGGSLGFTAWCGAWRPLETIQSPSFGWDSSIQLSLCWAEVGA